MCVAPYEIRPGVKVNCGSCDWCRENRVLDFVGRCLAESYVSSRTLAVTLTYGAADEARAAQLHYRDVQLMLKRLRNDGFSVRYMCVGEYGSLKARAHWHCILFFRGKDPNQPVARNVSWKYWPHGFSYFQEPDYGGFKYLLKYTLKETDPGKPDLKQVRLSKNPPLGADYFLGRAKLFVDNRVAFQSPQYSFPGVVTRGGKTRLFWLQDRSLERFLENYCRLWNEAYGCNPPNTPELWQYLYDPLAKREADLDPAAFANLIENRRDAARKFVQINSALISETATPVQTGFLLLPPDGVLVSYSDGSAVLIWEGRKWQLSVNGTARGTVSNQLTLSGLTASLISDASAWLCQRAFGR